MLKEFLVKERVEPIIHWKSIYRWIYDDKNKDKKLWEYLPRKQKKRHEKYGRKVIKIKIPNRVSIHTRGKTIESRRTFGHWEADSIIGRQTRRIKSNGH